MFYSTRNRHLSYSRVPTKSQFNGAVKNVIIAIIISIIIIIFSC